MKSEIEEEIRELKNLDDFINFTYHCTTSDDREEMGTFFVKKYLINKGGGNKLYQYLKYKLKKELGLVINIQIS